ncbi:MAG: bifunctional anthranilate synthase component II/anthranilate phosphoribosyltransferase [Chitinivibrionales bacterium]|nr:bifunctional anthranilate synthase component II/anthranilate phosphoribosyltransferase [Chitinivibrionales bacterium]
MVLMIDNFDSFTYNIVQYLMQLGEKVMVYRNNELDVDSASRLEFDYLVVSPGPGVPSEAGCSEALIRHFAGKKPILGVCLGHQAIGEVFGGTIIQAKRIMHGKNDMIGHDGKTIFSGVANPLRAIRYHSLIIEEATCPKDLEISARSSDGDIMAVRHSAFPIEGVQFHPESIGTEGGIRLLKNFLLGVRPARSPVTSIFRKRVGGQYLTEQEASDILEQITEGDMTQAQMGSLLTALSMKEATVEEITGFARLLQKKMVPLPLPQQMHCVDTCGTGGDASGTFNISTAAALIACGSGATVVKHGNRSVTSQSGSADVLEALGVGITLPPQQAAAMLRECGMCFCFAPLYHPAFKRIGATRKELGFRTVFNMMGPMLNPARAQSQVMGVSLPEYTETVAQVLNNLGVKHALVVHGHDGLDELSLTGPSKVTELNNGWIRSTTIDPADFGLQCCALSDLKGGSATVNSQHIMRILHGERGPKRDVAVLNAAAALVAVDRAPDLKSGCRMAQESIDSGAAARTLEKLIAFTRSHQSK